jgi:hypothetical protein
LVLVLCTLNNLVVIRKGKSVQIKSCQYEFSEAVRELDKTSKYLPYVFNAKCYYRYATRGILLIFISENSWKVFCVTLTITKNGNCPL